MFTQLDPPIPLDVDGRGPGHAIAVIDYGQEHHLIWVTAITATGEIWCAPNPRVRISGNWTMERGRSIFADASPTRDEDGGDPQLPDSVDEDARQRVPEQEVEQLRRHL